MECLQAMRQNKTERDFCEICVTHGTLCHSHRIENLERQLAQAKAVIEQQKEVIEQLQSDRRTSSESFDILVSKYAGCKNQYEYMSDKVDTQSALIETLVECIKEHCSPYLAHDAEYYAAVSAYHKWKESK
jgi:chromosome segregation ATPase